MATQRMACPGCGETSGLETLERATIARPAAFTVRVESPASVPTKYREPLSRVRFVPGVDVVEHDEDGAVTVPDLGASEWFDEVRCRECRWHGHVSELVPLQD